MRITCPVEFVLSRHKSSVSSWFNGGGPMNLRIEVERRMKALTIMTSSLLTCLLSLSLPSSISFLSRRCSSLACPTTPSDSSLIRLASSRTLRVSVSAISRAISALRAASSSLFDITTGVPTTAVSAPPPPPLPASPPSCAISDTIFVPPGDAGRSLKSSLLKRATMPGTSLALFVRRWPLNALSGSAAKSGSDGLCGSASTLITPVPARKAAPVGVLGCRSTKVLLPLLSLWL